MDELKIKRALNRALKEDYFLEKAWKLMEREYIEDNHMYNAATSEMEDTLLSQYNYFSLYRANDLQELINHRTEEIRKSVISPTAMIL